MLFLIAYELFLGRFHFHLQIDELLLEPVRRLHGGIESGLEIIFDVSLHQRIDDSGCFLGIRAAVVDFNDAGTRNESNSQTPLKTAHHGSGL